jgi:hypothetical protein
VRGANEITHENPYKAPQTTDLAITPRRRPLWLGVAGVVFSWLGVRAASQLFVSVWAVYLLGGLLGSALFLAMLAIGRRRGWLPFGSDESQADQERGAAVGQAQTIEA